MAGCGGQSSTGAAAPGVSYRDQVSLCAFNFNRQQNFKEPRASWLREGAITFGERPRVRVSLDPSFSIVTNAPCVVTLAYPRRRELSVFLVGGESGYFFMSNVRQRPDVVRTERQALCCPNARLVHGMVILLQP
jgi:hypothetical protein